MAAEDAEGAPTASTAVPDILRAAEEFVRAEVAGNDASHDFGHIDRVRRNALAIAAAEGVADPHPLFIIQLASLLHDVGDWKVSKRRHSRPPPRPAACPGALSRPRRR